MKRNSNPEVLVIGAGLGGLLTACFAARAGHGVVVKDSGDVGGRARGLALGGQTVNPGPRAIYRGGALDRALRTLGVRVPGFRPPVAGFAFAGGALVPLPTSPASLLSTSLLPTTAAKKEAALALARVTVGAFDAGVDETIGSWIARHASRDDVRDLLRALCRVSTYCPVGVAGGADDVDAGLVLRNLRAALTRGVVYTGGDWGVVVDALVACAVGSGVVIEDHARVDAADVEAADRVVVAGSPQMARTLASVPSSTEPVYASCLDLVLDHLPVPGRRFVLGVDRPLYFSVHTPPPGNDAPARGPVIVHALQYGGGATQQELEAFVDVVQPGWRAVARGARCLPKMVVMHDRPVAGKQRTGVVVDDKVRVVGDWVDARGLIADAVADAAQTAAQTLAASTKQQRAA